MYDLHDHFSTESTETFKNVLGGRRLWRWEWLTTIRHEHGDCTPFAYRSQNQWHRRCHRWSERFLQCWLQRQSKLTRNWGESVIPYDSPQEWVWRLPAAVQEAVLRTRGESIGSTSILGIYNQLLFIGSKTLWFFFDSIADLKNFAFSCQEDKNITGLFKQVNL